MLQEISNLQKISNVLIFNIEDQERHDDTNDTYVNTDISFPQVNISVSVVAFFLVC
jgi:hypothetical protein